MANTKHTEAEDYLGNLVNPEDACPRCHERNTNHLEIHAEGMPDGRDLVDCITCGRSYAVGNPIPSEA